MLDSILSAARAKLGITDLTPMQRAMAKRASSRGSVALIAPTGSGKTLAFALPLLSAKGRGVVLAPSRELALQIAKVITALAPGRRVAALYGGHSMLEEKRTLEGALPSIIIATPGRLLDHVQRGNLTLRDVEVLVIDEYDKMLELGFADEMSRLARAMRSVKRIILTSATKPASLPEFIASRNPETLDFTHAVEAPAVECFNVLSPEADKLPVLKQLLLHLPAERTIVFVNHRESAERVFDFLKKCGFPTVLYHGALDQQERETAIDIFDNGTAPLMVATDLAGRGLDIRAVDSVIHYHQAPSAEMRTHRNGRTARMGASGRAFTLVGPNETAPEGSPFTPASSPQSWIPTTATLYFHAGKKEKLSKGDVVGALTKLGGLHASDIGIIALHDHRTLAAIPAHLVAQLLPLLNSSKIKGHKIRVTAIK